MVRQAAQQFLLCGRRTWLLRRRPGIHRLRAADREPGGRIVIQMRDGAAKEEVARTIQRSEISNVWPRDERMRERGFHPGPKLVNHATQLRRRCQVDLFCRVGLAVIELGAAARVEKVMPASIAQAQLCSRQLLGLEER